MVIFETYIGTSMTFTIAGDGGVDGLFWENQKTFLKFKNTHTGSQ